MLEESPSRGGGVCSGGVSAPGGVCWGGVCSLGEGGVCSGGCLFRGGCLLLGGVCCRGVSAPKGGVCSWGGMYPSMHWGRHPHLLTKSQTPVKTLPWPNFVAAGNNLQQDHKIDRDTTWVCKFRYLSVFFDSAQLTSGFVPKTEQVQFARKSNSERQYFAFWSPKNYGATILILKYVTFCSFCFPSILKCNFVYFYLQFDVCEKFQACPLWTNTSLNLCYFGKFGQNIALAPILGNWCPIPGTLDPHLLMCICS